MSALPPEPRTGDFIQSLERGLLVIKSFDQDSPAAQTLSDVAQATGLTRATARRILLTLVQLGYVAQSDRWFSLTPKVLDLGYSYLSSTPVIDLALPSMERLVAQLQESSSVSVLHDGEVVYIARVPTKRIMTISLAVGSRLPAYPTSMGRVLLAGLPDEEIDRYLAATRLEQLTPHTVTDPSALKKALEKVRADGYSLVDQELEEGVRSVAAPITSRRNRVIAAINVSGHASRVTVRQLRTDYVPRLLEAAAEVSIRMAALDAR